MSAILQSTRCHVRASGEIVIATFGDLSFNLDHETAIGIAVDLRMLARRLKYVAEDASRKFTVQGTLHDAHARKPDTLIEGRVAKRFDYDVTAEGKVLKLRLQRTTIKIGYAEALKLAGWFRLAGKNARNTAGDNRHWTRIKDVEDSIARATEMVPSNAL